MISEGRYWNFLQGTEKIIDRAAEMSNMQRMQEIKCGGELYCSFRNGLCYEFLPGQVLSQARLWEEKVWRGVAGRMARMHRSGENTCSMTIVATS